MFRRFLMYIILAVAIMIKVSADIRIRPHGIGTDGSLYVLSEGARVELECQVDKGFNGPEDVEDLDWFREKLRIEQNWLSMFTQPKADEQGRWIRQTLVIPKVDAKSAGQYKCVFYDEQQREINIHVLETLTWRTTTSKPGGPVGQPLTIDCGANGVNDQDIKILDHKGRAIDEATNGDVVVAGPDVTIPKLGREHHGMKIRCVAIRRIILEKLGAVGPDSLHTDERELMVNVWLPPKFDESPQSKSSAGVHFAVPGSKQVLRWTITESNPPVRKWTLKKDGQPIWSSGDAPLPAGRMQIVQRMEEEAQPMFAISIEEVQDSDYGRYTLHVHNGKLDAEKTMSLVATKPPGQPRVRAEWTSSNGSVSWRVEENQQKGQLPVSYFWIYYKPVRRIQMASQNISKTSGTGFHQHGQPPFASALPPLNPNITAQQQPYRLRRRKNPNNLYDIAGLDPYTEYEFTFVAGNQAGESDPLTQKVSILDRSPNELLPSTSSASGRRLDVKNLFGLLGIVMVAMSLGVCALYKGFAHP